MRRKLICTAVIAIGISVSLLCTNELNPFQDPGNAGVANGHYSLSDTAALSVGTTYRCSVDVRLPALIDSFFVRLTIGGADTIIAADNSVAAGYPWITFTLDPRDTGTIGVAVFVIRSDNTADSLVAEYSAADAAPPVIVLLGDTTAPILAMPCTLAAVVTDNWGVDSVMFNSGDMQLSGDTARYTTSGLDTGTTLDSITAWDRAGNRSVIRFHLTYHGPKAYPPVVKIADRQVNEGGVFNVILLDTSAVTIADSQLTPAQRQQFALDSVTWTITDSAGVTLPINTVNHTVGITIPIPANYPFADSEWTGTFKITFVAVEKRNNLSSDARQVVFQVKEVSDAPRITLSSIFGCGKTYFDTVYLDTSTTVVDPDNLPSQLQWNFVNGTWLKVDSVYKCISIALGKSDAGIINPIGPRPFCTFARKITVSPINPADSARTGTDTLTFFVTDPTAKTAQKRVPVSRNATCFIIYP